MSLIFRDPYSARGTVARWLSALSGRKASGVYVIREKGIIWTPILYVGESHTGALYKTILRHFQNWTGKTAGATYPRTKVEVAVIRTADKTALERQNKLIAELDPRDNIEGKPESPF